MCVRVIIVSLRVVWDSRRRGDGGAADYPPELIKASFYERIKSRIYYALITPFSICECRPPPTTRESVIYCCASGKRGAASGASAPNYANKGGAQRIKILAKWNAWKDLIAHPLFILFNNSLTRLSLSCAAVHLMTLFILFPRSASASRLPQQRRSSFRFHLGLMSLWMPRPWPGWFLLCQSSN